MLAGITDGILAGVADSLLDATPDGILAGVSDGIVAGRSDGILAIVTACTLTNLTDGTMARPSLMAYWLVQRTAYCLLQLLAHWLA